MAASSLICMVCCGAPDASEEDWKDRRVFGRRPTAIVAIALGVVLGSALIYFVGVNYVGGWKVAPDRCLTSDAAPDGGPDLSATRVHKTSAWLPYWECTRVYRDGSMRRT